jgi:hypothetical protein
MNDVTLMFIMGLPLILIVLFGYRLLRSLGVPSLENEIFIKHKTILDNKLLPLGFNRSEIKSGTREITISYELDFTEIALSYEPPFRANHVYINKGAGLINESNLVLDLDSDTVRNNFSKILDKWLLNNL